MSSNLPSKAMMEETMDPVELQNPVQDINILMEDTYDLVEKGKLKIKQCDNCKNVVLVLGATGSGKSTFTQWIAGDNSKLKSEEIGEGEYLIYDDERISRSTIISKTVYPELVFDPISKTVFYDCPGFGDTRNTSFALATTYFIKEVADLAEGIKIIFTINYHSVRKGLERRNFMSLMRNVSDFIKNIDTFRQSVAIVVTKVDNSVKKVGENYKLVSDESIIKTVAKFLIDVKQDIKEIRTTKRDYDAAAKIIDILLSKREEQYTRIGLFRRPDDAGPLNEIVSCQNAKEPIRAIFKELCFANKTNHSFGYGLSEESKNDINGIVLRINQDMSSSFDTIALQVKKYFLDLKETIDEKFNSLTTITENVENDLIEARAHFLKYKNESIIVSKLVKNLKGLKDQEKIIQLVSNKIYNLGIDVNKEALLLLINHGKYLKFLEKLCERDLQTKQWNEIFKDTLTSFDVSESDFQILIHTTREKISNRVTDILHGLIKAMQDEYHKKIKLLDVETLLHELRKDQVTLLDKMKNINLAITINELVETLCECEKDLGIYISRKDLSNLLKLEKCVQFLETLSKNQIKTETLTWSKAMQDMNVFLQESEKWYTFLADLYTQLSKYEIQKQKDIYNVRDINDWGQFTRKRGIKIRSENFLQFLDKITNSSAAEDKLRQKLDKPMKKVVKPLQKIGKNHKKFKEEHISELSNKIINYSLAEVEAIKNLPMTDLKLCDVNHVLDLTLKSNTSISFIENAIVIKGDYISLKNIPGITNTGIKIPTFSDKNETLFKLQGNLKIVCFFASNKIFIDQDIVFKDKKISVLFFAPTCEVVGIRKIDLIGRIHGGFFFSICHQLVNFKKLTILTDKSQESLTQLPSKTSTNLYSENVSCSQIIDAMDKIHNRRGAFKTDSKLGFIVANVLVREQPTTLSRIKGAFLKKRPKYVVNIFTVTTDRETYATETTNNSVNKVEDCENRTNEDRPSPICKNFIKYITLFRQFLILDMHNRFKKKLAFQCLRLLDNSEVITKAYTELEFHYELSLCAMEYTIFYESIDFNGFYQSLLQRISYYTQNLNSDDISSERYILLKGINFACSANINKSQYKYDCYLIKDINNHLVSVKKCLEGLKGPQTVEKILHMSNFTADAYKKNIDQKIKNIDDLINANICLEIDNIKEKSNNKIEELIEEILISKKQSETEKQNLQNTKEELQKSIMVRMGFALFEVFDIINALGKVAVAVGCVLKDNGLPNERTMSSDDQDLTNGSISLPLKTNIEWIKNQKSLEDNFQNIQKTKNDLHREQNIKEKKSKYPASKPGHKCGEISETITKNKVTTKVLVIGCDLHDKYKNDGARLDIITNSVEEVEDKIHILKLHEDKIFLSMFTMLVNMEGDICNAEQMLDEKGQIFFNITEWKVQDTLKNVKSQIIKLIRDLEVFAEYVHYIDRLEESMIMMIHVYDHLQSFQDLQGLYGSISNYYTASNNDINFSNKKLSDAFKQIHEIIDFSLLSKQYKMLMDVFKQWTFPFAYLYAEQYQLPPLSQGRWEEFVSIIIKKVKDVSKIITDHKRTAQNHENDVYIAEFHSDYISTQPFFVWKNGRHGDMISVLLSGRKAVAKADIMMSPSDKDAIKFIYVDLYFRAIDKDMQSALNEALKKYKVKASHLGNSTYRCGDRIYVIPSGSHTIEWSFEKLNSGEPIYKNKTYDMLKSSDIMLSPYAMWEIELMPFSDNGSFNELEIYKNQVDMELIGRGSYITKKTDLSRLMLEKYYKEFLI